MHPSSLMCNKSKKSYTTPPQKWPQKEQPPLGNSAGALSTGSHTLNKVVMASIYP
eukprot:c17846_g1_i1 orf=199-363(-)